MEYEQILEKIVNLMSEQFDIDPSKLKDNTDILNDLGVDSLDVVELAMNIEEEFGIPQISEDDIRSIVTIGDLANYISRAMG